MLTFNLNFYGYTWDGYLMYIARKRGIFLVYRGKIRVDGIFEMEELLHISLVDDLDSFNNSEIVAKIRSSINSDERLFFSYAEIEGFKTVDRIIDALVMYSHPKFNIQRKVSGIRILCSGNCAFLPSEILL